MTTHYTFQYALQDDCGPEFPTAKTLQSNLQFHDETTWDVVLTEFINFLSSVYGYDIHNSVKFLSFDEKLEKLKDKYEELEESDESKSLDLDDDEEWRKIL